MDGRMDRGIMEGWMDRDGWVDRGMIEGWTEGWMEGWTEVITDDHVPASLCLRLMMGVNVHLLAGPASLSRVPHRSAC